MSDAPSIAAQTAAVRVRRAWVLFVLGLIIPGSAQAVYGRGRNRSLGRFALKLWMIVVVVVILALVALLIWRKPVLGFFTTGWVMTAVGVVLIALAAFWLILGIDTVMIARPHGLTGRRGPVFAAVALVVSAALACGTAYVGQAMWVVGGTSVLYQGQALNILVLGTDSRAGGNAAVSNDDTAGSRSDTTFIMHIAADRSRVDLVSIPRDILITIPQCVGADGKVISQAGTKNAGFNAAFSYGSLSGNSTTGAACSIMAVEAMSGVPIDAYVVVDFAGFVQIVDAVGGVDLTLPCPIYSPDADGLKLPAGDNHLDGLTATNYMRARTGINLGDGSDLGRIARQHALLQALAGKVLAMNYLTNVPKLLSLVTAVDAAITTNLGSNLEELAGFAASLKGLSLSNMGFHMIPVANAGDGAHVVLVPDKDQPIWDALKSDKPLPDSGTTVTAPPPTQSSATSAPTSGGTAGSGATSAPSTPAPPAPKCAAVPGE